MNAMATERNDKTETTSERTPSTVSADTDDTAITPRSPISSDRSDFEQPTPTTNNNENQTGAPSLRKRKNVDEHGQFAATKSLKPLSTRPPYRHKAAPWYSVNINMFLDLAVAMFSSLLGLCRKRQTLAAPSFPLLKTSFHQDIEGEYEELWLRSPGVRCSERTLVYMVPGNPGLVKAHLNFMSMICSSNDFDGCIMSHLGHCPFSTKVFGIKDHIAHHSRMIKKHSESYHKVLVVGHSTGSHIILEITDTLVELGDRLLGIGLLAPTLTRFPAVSYWCLRYLLKESKVSSFFRELIIQVNVPAEIRGNVYKGKFIPNIENLARDTLDILPDELPSERLTYWGVEKRKLFIINSSWDPYMSLDAQHAARCCIESPDISEPSVLILSSIGHCFILSVKESAIVSSLTDQWIVNKRFDCSKYDGLP